VIHNIADGRKQVANGAVQPVVLKKLICGVVVGGVYDTSNAAAGLIAAKTNKIHQAICIDWLNDANWLDR
jgi:hypothetical protein